MDAFAERMEARKQKEAHDNAERMKQTSLEKYTVAIQFNILAKSEDDVKEALHMFMESMKGFSDISDVIELEL